MDLPITEQASLYDNLDQCTPGEIIGFINREDHRVADAVERCLPQIEAFVSEALERMKQGGRLFYIGAGTSGRLGVLDASELPTTFGVAQGRVIGIIAGGDTALRNAVENAEDDPMQGWKDIEAFSPTPLDCVVGIAASGTTPYVVGAIDEARRHGLLTAAITSNPSTPLASAAKHAFEMVVGPEVITGSSRMKSGTGQKMILNMISTSLMVKLGHVKGNRMVNMQLTNNKLNRRAQRMLCEMLGVNQAEAISLLEKYGSVDKALKSMQK